MAISANNFNQNDVSESQTFSPYMSRKTNLPPEGAEGRLLILILEVNTNPECLCIYRYFATLPERCLL